MSSGDCETGANHRPLPVDLVDLSSNANRQADLRLRYQTHLDHLARSPFHPTDKLLHERPEPDLQLGLDIEFQTGLNHRLEILLLRLFRRLEGRIRGLIRGIRGGRVGRQDLGGRTEGNKGRVRGNVRDKRVQLVLRISASFEWEGRVILVSGRCQPR
jgi:hypothetical protein